MNAILTQLKSKKLIVAILTAVAIVINDHFGKPLSEDTINQMIAVVAAYVIGQGIADSGKEKAKIEVANLPKGEPAWEDTTEIDIVDGGK